MKSNGAGAEFDFKITKKYLFLLLRVQLQCNVDELGRKSTEVIAELDLFSLRVNIALESTLVHRVQLQCNADEMEGKSAEAIGEFDFQRVSIAEESVVDHRVQLQCKVNELNLSYLRVEFA